MYNVSIPEITEEELKVRYKRIKPIVEIEGKKYLLREYTQEELREKSYIWDLEHDKRGEVNIDEYVPLVDYDFECIHKYGYYGFFKPSIAEVLAQIPQDLAGLVDFLR